MSKRIVTPEEHRLWQMAMTKMEVIEPATLAKRHRPTKLDLHGLTIEDAFQRTTAFLHDSHEHGIREVVIVTGRSGMIVQEFPDWLDRLAYINGVDVMGNGGAYRVRLRRKSRRT